VSAADLAIAPWDHMAGVFPHCERCGVRVAHTAVKLCAHCRIIAPDIWCVRCGPCITCPHPGTWKVLLPRTAAETYALHALRYAHHGWEVLPLNGKDPSWLGRGGVHNATNDLMQVARWWSGRRYRGANIGIHVPANMFVLDVDGPDRVPTGTGLQALAAVEAEHGPLPPTLTQISGSGGLHLFFRKPPGKLSKTGLPDGLDLKERGGLVVAAPSIHPDSRERYVWCEHPIADPPAWLVDMIVAKPRPTSPPRSLAKIAAAGHNPHYVRAALDKELSDLAAAPNGRRNKKLAKVSVAVFEFAKGGHCGQQWAWDELTRIADVIGLEESEIKATLTHALDKAQPRDIPQSGFAPQVIETTPDKIK
jgi:hypothetical protein